MVVHAEQMTQLRKASLTASHFIRPSALRAHLRRARRARKRLRVARQGVRGARRAPHFSSDRSEMERLPRRSGVQGPRRPMQFQPNRCDLRRYEPRCHRTLSIARLGSTNTLGAPKSGFRRRLAVVRTSVISASSAVSLSRFNTSTRISRDQYQADCRNRGDIGNR